MQHDRRKKKDRQSRGLSAEQIVTLLRQIEVLMAQGKSAPEACREAGISQQNHAMSC
jgi:hypothetical protein